MAIRVAPSPIREISLRRVRLTSPDLALSSGFSREPDGLTAFSGLNFLLLIVEDLHCHRVGRAAYRAQPAANAFLIVFQHGRQWPAQRDAFVLNDPLLNFRIEIQFFDGHELQTVFGTDIDAAIAEDALLCIVDGLNMAVETALGLLPRFVFRVAGLNLRHARAAIERDRRRSFALALFVIVRASV